MITLFYIILGISLFHLFYENVVGPSLRHQLRYKFFALRDELRNLEIDGKLDPRDKEIYKEIDRSICAIIESMSIISITYYFVIRKSKGNSSLNSDIKKTKNRIANAKTPELIEIDDKLKPLNLTALIINDGVWLPYLLFPLLLILIFVLVTNAYKQIKAPLTYISSTLFYSNNKPVRKFHNEVIV